MDNETIDKIKELHARGLSNREIARQSGVGHHATVGRVLDNCGLPYRKRTRIEISQDRGQCVKCEQWLVLKKFCSYTYKGEKVIRAECRACFRKGNKAYLTNNFDAFLHNRIARLRNKCLKTGKDFELDLAHVKLLWEIQNGRCVYTGEAIDKTPPTVKKFSFTLSFDRFDNNKGYTKDNVLLCLRAANTVKSNLDVVTLKKWLPSFYRKGNKMLLEVRKRLYAVGKN